MNSRPRIHLPTRADLLPETDNLRDFSTFGLVEGAMHRTAGGAEAQFIVDELARQVVSALEALNYTPADVLEKLTSVHGDGSGLDADKLDGQHGNWYAPKNSPDLTGEPKAPTPPTSDASHRVATTGYVQAAIAELINPAPGALDTLQELAVALGNDPNFAATVTAALAGKAPLASPALTGTPSAPTAAAGTNNTQLATTAFVTAALLALNYTANDVRAKLLTVDGTGSGVDADLLDGQQGEWYAPVNSAALTGEPTAPTPAVGDNSARLATTAFVKAIVAALNYVASDVLSKLLTVDGTGSGLDADLLDGQQGAWYAPIGSPALTGSPTAPTPATETSTTRLATTAFVHAVVAALGYGADDIRTKLLTVDGAGSGVDADLLDGQQGNWYAPKDSAALTGTPTAPTPANGDNTGKVATTAFVQTAIANLIASAPGALDTLNELAAALGNDPNFAATIANALALKAPLASPALTGTPTAPTPGAGDNSTRIATTAFVKALYAAVAGGETAAAILSKLLTVDGTGSGLDADLLDGQQGAWYAPIGSPALTGSPTAPTPATETSTTRLATTAFVHAVVAALGYGADDIRTKLLTVDGAGSGVDADLLDGQQGNWYAPKDSAALTGTPTAPTPGAGDNSTRIATTAFVKALYAAVAGGETAAAILSKLLTVDGTGSGLDADLLDGQESIFYRNADNLSAGTLPDARLPGRLNGFAKDVTDWNTATGSGWYRSNPNVANVPVAGAYILGYVETFDASWSTQTVHCFVDDTSADTRTYRRSLNYEGWGPWYRLRISEAEQDGRYLFKWDAALTGPLTLHGYGTNQFKTGNGDGASYATHNIILKGLWGMGMAAYDDSVNGFYDFRAGKWDVKDGYYVNGVPIGINVAFVTANTAVAAGSETWCSTTAAALTMTLPAAPAVGARIVIHRRGGYNVTIARNGKTIAGLDEDLVIEINRRGVELIWSGSTWIPQPRRGER